MHTNWEDKSFTIGEISKIHNISPKMLRYWDHIGLLKPNKVDKESLYRYYSSSQFHIINYIKHFKKMEIPYEDIKNKLHEADMMSIKSLLEEQIELLEDKIHQLETIKKMYYRHLKDINHVLYEYKIDERPYFL